MKQSIRVVCQAAEGYLARYTSAGALLLVGRDSTSRNMASYSRRVPTCTWVWVAQAERLCLVGFRLLQTNSEDAERRGRARARG